MIKTPRSVRPHRARALGVECLEGRAVLSGGTNAAVAAAQQVALSLTPTLEESYLLRSGDTVTGLVMIFSKPLDPATAQDPNNYQLENSIAAAADNAISAAVYSPSQDSVTLMLAQPFTLNPTPTQEVFMVTVPPGSTITDTSGHALIAEGYLLAEFNSQGTQPNPLFGTYVQSRINAKLIPLAEVASTVASNSVDPIHLTGTINGTYYPIDLWSHDMIDMPERTPETVTKGAGSIGPLGHVTESVNESPFFNLQIQGKSFQNQDRTLKTKQGQVWVAFNDLQWTSSSSLAGDYTIVGGTGIYAGETGSGHIQVMWTGNTTRGKVTEIYS